MQPARDRCVTADENVVDGPAPGDASAPQSPGEVLGHPVPPAGLREERLQ